MIETKITWGGGIGLGTLLAVIVSVMSGNTLGWVILHGLLGWIYIIYYLIKYGVTF